MVLVDVFFQPCLGRVVYVIVLWVYGWCRNYICGGIGACEKGLKRQGRFFTLESGWLKRFASHPSLVLPADFFSFCPFGVFFVWVKYVIIG